MKKKDILHKVKRLRLLFNQGKIPTLPQHEVNPGLPLDSRENYLYFTLPPCINFQRGSPAMWASALKTYEDPKTNYLFFPEKVILKTREKVQKDLIKHKLGLQLNKHTDIWIAISKSINDLFGGDPRKIFEHNNWDVVQIQNFIQVHNKKHFPYLSGPKMTNYWLYILSNFTDAKFRNMQEITVIPDTHVLQCTMKLGLTDTLPASLTTVKLWKDLLKGSEITPVEMHPVLWNWSRNNFKPEV